MNKLKNQFLEVSDALNLGNPAIIEKDYWVVMLLAELSKLTFETHQMVFSGGTALAKSNIKIFRMSEDVDIKLLPRAAFNSFSRDKRKAARKALTLQIEEHLTHPSSYFSIQKRKVRDEYRYIEYELKYPQQFTQIPCLRPIIKLELIETCHPFQIEQRNIQSLVSELYQQPKEIKAFNCVSIHSTLVEKVVSMLRRTMLVKRHSKYKDDITLIRHVYDVHCIATSQSLEFETLKPIFQQVLQEDIKRFGNQHALFVEDPIQELQLGIQELETNPLHRQRFTDFVTPMVFNIEKPNFGTCFNSFKHIAQALMENDLAA